MSTSAPAATAVQFAITPISPGFVQRVRATLRDDFGRPVRIEVAKGGEPMRDQLRRAAPGERLILCSYQAVPLPSLFAEIGPVYISAEAAAAATVTDTLPANDYFNRTFAVRTYDARDHTIESALVDPAEAADKFRALLAKPGTAYLHARFGGHGCFAARIDRDGHYPSACDCVPAAGVSAAPE